MTIKILALPETQNASITVHLGPREFETKGYRTDNETSLSGWQLRAGTYRTSSSGWRRIEAVQWIPGGTASLAAAELRAPKARFIPAWASGPVKSRDEDRRAEGPIQIIG